MEKNRDDAIDLDVFATILVCLNAIFISQIVGNGNGVVDLFRILGNVTHGVGSRQNCDKVPRIVPDIMFII